MSRKSAPKKSHKGPSSSTLWLTGSLGVLPLLAMGWFATRPAEPQKTRSVARESEQVEPARSKPPEDARSTTTTKRIHTQAGRDNLQEGSPLEEDQANSPDQARLDRFDDNARRFDERLTRFEKELRSGLDEAETVQISERVTEEFSRLVPDSTTTVQCTASVCVVEVTSELSVGTLLARLAPWLRKHPDRATGDPTDADDPQSFRMLFERENFPGSSVD